MWKSSFFCIVLIGLAITSCGQSKGDKKGKEKDCSCKEERSPVCGSDGVTYMNKCKLLCHPGVSVAQDGECGGNDGVLDKTTNTLLPAVDKTQKTLLGDKTVTSVDETKSKTPPLQLGVAKKNIGIT